MCIRDSNKTDETDTAEAVESAVANDEQEAVEQVEKKPVHESTAIPPLAPMSGSDALTNANPMINGAKDPADDPAAEFIDFPDESLTTEAEVETASAPVDPPMFGDR